MSGDQIAQRVYAIRLALGDGWKTPMPMADFAALLNGAGGTRFDSSVVSRIESGGRKLTLSDVAVIAAIDPARRGKLWLGWGEEQDATRDQPLITFRIPDSMAETFSRARRDAATPAPAPDQPKKKVAGGRRAPKHPKGRQ